MTIKPLNSNQKPDQNQKNQKPDPSTTSSIEDLAWVDEPGADPQPEAPGGEEFTIHDPEGGGGTVEYLMGAEEFYQLFQALVVAPNTVLEMKGVDPFISFNVAAQSSGCRQASDALYKTCRDVSWLNFMLEPEAVWLQRAMPVGLFVLGTYKAVKLELDQRTKTKAPDPEQQTQAETSAPPPPQDNQPGADQGVVTLKVGGAA